MIHFDCKNVDARVIGDDNGLYIDEEFNAYSEKIKEILLDLNQRKDKPGHQLQWMNLGYNEETLWYVKEYASMIKDRFENLVVLGIGGSVLGGMALAEALLKPYWNYLSKEDRQNYPRIFFFDNIDPDSTVALLNTLDLSKTLINVITKSGDTAETMSQFMIVKDRLEKELGDNYRYNIVATTDKKIGILRQISEQEGYKTFVIPDDVGGRFSVFSAAGLLPLAILGVDLDEVVNGIKDMDLSLKNTDIYHNIAAQNALVHYLLDIKKNKCISVMMPYSNRLKFLSDWYVQLWSESLGKNSDKFGNSVSIGQTPLRALGVTDQHSQLQLFNEGPNNKIINFIRVKDFDNVLNIPQIFEYTGIGYLGGKTLNQLMDAEADATRVTLTDYCRPNVTITIDKVDGYHLGQLLYMLEVQAAIAGELYNIDTFNQPGVEQAKNYTYALMGRVGYEESANVLREKMGII